MNERFLQKLLLPVHVIKGNLEKFTCFWISLQSASMKMSCAPSDTPGVRSICVSAFNDSFHSLTRYDRGKFSPAGVMVTS